MENDFWKPYKDKGLQVVAIDLAEDAAKVKKYRDKHGVTYPILLDSDKSVSARFTGNGTPWNLVVDQQGIIRYSAPGYDPDVTAQKMKSVVDGLLQNPAKPQAKL